MDEKTSARTPAVPAMRSAGPLPASPRLRPDARVLPAGPERLGVGVSPRALLLLENAPAGLAQWLAGLDGTRTLVAALGSCPCSPREAVDLLHALQDGGLLLDGAVSDDWAGPVAATRAGTRGRSVRVAPELGVLSQTRRLALPATSGCGPITPVTLSGSGLLVPALMQALTAAGIAVGTPAGADPVAGSLTVHVVDGTVREADLAACDRATAAGLSTLLVELTAVDAVIGHVHLPSAAPCQRCAVLLEPEAARRWRDWSDLEPRRPVRVAPHLQLFVLGAAVDRIVAALDALRGRARPVALQSRLLLDLRGMTVRDQFVPVQPCCHCLPAPALAG